VLEKRSARLEREALAHNRMKLRSTVEQLRTGDVKSIGNLLPRRPPGGPGGVAEVERLRKEALEEAEETLRRYDELLEPRNVHGRGGGKNAQTLSTLQNVRLSSQAAEEEEKKQQLRSPSSAPPRSAAGSNGKVSRLKLLFRDQSTGRFTTSPPQKEPGGGDRHSQPLGFSPRRLSFGSASTTTTPNTFRRFGSSSRPNAAPKPKRAPPQHVITDSFFTSDALREAVFPSTTASAKITGAESSTGAAVASRRKSGRVKEAYAWGVRVPDGMFHKYREFELFDADSTPVTFGDLMGIREARWAAEQGLPPPPPPPPAGPLPAVPPSLAQPPPPPPSSSLPPPPPPAATSVVVASNKPKKRRRTSSSASAPKDSSRQKRVAGVAGVTAATAFKGPIPLPLQPPPISLDDAGGDYNPHVPRSRP
jgi:hypothetical protein